MPIMFKRLTSRLSSTSSRRGMDEDDGDVWELGGQSGVPYEPLGEQTEAVNQLYEHVESINPAGGSPSVLRDVPLDGATTGESGTDDNHNHEVSGSDSFPSFNTRTPPPSTAVYQNRGKSRSRWRLLLGVVVVVIIVTAFIVAIAVPISLGQQRQPQPSAQALWSPDPSWLQVQGSMEVLSWNYTHIMGAYTSMGALFSQHFCANVESVLHRSPALSSLFQHCVLNNMTWNFAAASGHALYSVYLTAGKAPELSLQRSTAQALLDAVTNNSFPGMVIDRRSLTFVGDGDDCAMSKCGQACEEGYFTYTCSCPDGYQLDSDQRGCSDIDECSLGRCEHNCTNTEGSYKCNCLQGYKLTHGENCTDINECSSSYLNLCDLEKSRCENTNGSFVCVCHQGYRSASDGFSCLDIDECASGTSLQGSEQHQQQQPHGCEQLCNNTMGSYTCTCLNGYQLADDGRTCKDVDECKLGTDTCHHTCYNTLGSYTCDCHPGFSLSNVTGRCDDIDECSMNLCDQGCNNTNGSYICFCERGYLLESDGRTCTDMDECLGQNACTQQCTNTQGSYSCGCYRGYRLDSDGRTCNDIDECWDSSCADGQLCENAPGSYRCKCYNGYQMEPGGNCTDIDECSQPGHGCPFFCQNTEGSFRCTDHDANAVCPRILLNGDIYKQTSRQGVFSLVGGKSCSGREVYEMEESGGGTFLYYSANSSRWLVSSSLCDIKAGIRSVQNMTYPTDGTSGDWQVAFSKIWKNSTIRATCLEDTYNCTTDNHPCSGGCENVSPTGLEPQLTYRCGCPEGLTLAPDKHHCLDVDECLTNTSQCPEFCLNTEGSFQCVAATDAALCRRLEVVNMTLDGFQSERSGEYYLILNHPGCDGRPLWKQQQRDNYLYFLGAMRFWVMGATPCDTYVGILAEGHTSTPWEVPAGGWDYWNSSHWVPEAQMKVVCLGDAAGCADGEFQCPASGECIPGDWRCDLWDDCGDNSDEDGCPCPDHLLKCADGQCVSGVFNSQLVDWCDGVKDCNDGSDEMDNCTCLAGQFSCGANTSRPCISEAWKCDGDEDCDDGTDERDCPCLEGQMRCEKSDLCINSFWVCDGEDDCGDWSDELNCTCSADEFQCTMGMCITAKNYCNGPSSCPDGSDEPENCTCLPSLYTCPVSGECLLESDLCDGFNDCADLSDEEGCGCPSYMHNCSTDGRCYYTSWACDGEDDCGDMSDENNCPCDKDTFMCTDGRCVAGYDWNVFCNGRAECRDGSDEPEDCATMCLPDVQFACASRCVPITQRCDGEINCKDGGDEAGCNCTEFQRRCDNGLCKSSRRFCDGVNDCGDWSDETNCTCAENEAQCDVGVCVHFSDWCDGVKNCPDDSDEKPDCACHPLQFKCASGYCIPNDWLCDNFEDCDDGSDEYPIAKCECSSEQQTCDSGQCVSQRQWCDKRPDCDDKSDEKNCTCDPSDSFLCGNGVCVHKAWACDEEDDCGDLTDEDNCTNHTTLCPADTFRCGDYSFTGCLPTILRCDGAIDCPRGEDEQGCHSCMHDEFVCGNYECVVSGTRCDGHANCTDRSDEAGCVKLVTDHHALPPGLSPSFSLLLLHSPVSGPDPWVPVCADGWSDTWSDAACKQAGSGGVNMTFYADIHGANSNTTLGLAQLRFDATTPGSQGIGLQAHVTMGDTNNCVTRKLVTVLCSPAPCGARAAVSLLQDPTASANPVSSAFTLEASPGTWPWLAGITVLEEDALFCGGTLVGADLVLTDQRCVTSLNVTSRLRVRLGSMFRSKHESGLVVSEVAQVFTTEAAPANTVALLKLATPVAFTEYIRPICLPTFAADETAEPPFHPHCYVAGWGKADESTDWFQMPERWSERLRAVRVLQLAPDHCPRNLTSHEVCAGRAQDGHSSVAACLVDMGGPVMCESSPGMWTLTGVATPVTVESCDPADGYGAIFISVTRLLNWLVDVMATH